MSTAPKQKNPQRIPPKREILWGFQTPQLLPAVFVADKIEWADTDVEKIKTLSHNLSRINSKQQKALLSVFSEEWVKLQKFTGIQCCYAWMPVFCWYISLFVHNLPGIT